MSSDSAQAQELAPAKRAMGFWPKIVVAVIIIVAGFMYIRSVAHKDMVIPVADVASPPPAETQDTTLPDLPLPVADIQLEGKGMSDAVPVTIGSVITEEVPVISAGASSESDERANQSEQQAAQSEPETLAAPMMRETAEAASVETDQAAAEIPAPETESMMVPPVIPTPPVASVEPPAQEKAVAEESETAPIVEAEPVFAAPAVEAEQAPGPDVVEGHTPMAPAPVDSGKDTGAGDLGGYPPHPSFKEMFGYDRPVPPEMPSRYDRFQGSESQERPKGDYQYPQRMMRRPFPGGMENRSYPGRHPGEYSRGYAPNYDQGYPGERGYGYGPGYSRGYAPPSGYQQGFAPGYPQGYQQGYAPGYSQGYPEDYSQPYPQGQNPYSGGNAPYRW